MVYSDSEIWKVIWNRFGPYTFGLFCTRVSDVSLHFCWRDELGHHSRPRTHGLPPDLGPENMTPKHSPSFDNSPKSSEVLHLGKTLMGLHYHWCKT